MSEVFRVGKKEIDISQIKGGIKFDSNMSEKNQTIFKALDGKLKSSDKKIGASDSVLDKEEITVIFNYLREIAGRNKKLGKREFQKLIKEYGLQDQGITAEDLAEFFESLVVESGNIKESHVEEDENGRRVVTEDNDGKIVTRNNDGTYSVKVKTDNVETTQNFNSENKLLSEEISANDKITKKVYEQADDGSDRVKIETVTDSDSEITYNYVTADDGNSYKVPKTKIANKGTENEFTEEYTVDDFGASLTGKIEHKDGTKITNLYLSGNDYEFNIDEDPQRQVVENENEIIETEKTTEEGRQVTTQKKYIKGENDTRRQILEDRITEEGRTINEYKYDEQVTEGKITRSEVHQYAKNDDGSITVTGYKITNYDDEGNALQTTLNANREVIKSEQFYTQKSIDRIKSERRAKIQRQRQAKINAQLASLGVDVRNKGADTGKKIKFQVPSTQTNGHNLIKGWQRKRVFNQDSREISSDDWRKHPERVEINCGQYKNVKELARDLFWMEGFNPDNSSNWQALILDRATKICKDWNIESPDKQLNGKRYLDMAQGRPGIQYVQKYAPATEGTVMGDVKGTDYQVVLGKDNQLYYVNKTTKKSEKPDTVRAKIAHANTSEAQEGYVYDGSGIGGGTVKVVPIGVTENGIKIGVDSAGHKYAIMSESQLKASDLISERTVFADRVKKSGNQTVIVRIDNEDGQRAFSQLTVANEVASGTNKKEAVALMRNIMSGLYEEICSAERSIYDRDRDLRNEDTKLGINLNQNLDKLVDHLTFAWNMNREEVLAKIKAEGDKIYNLTNVAYNINKGRYDNDKLDEEFIKEYEKIFGTFDTREIATLYATGSNRKLMSNINSRVNTEELHNVTNEYIQGQAQGVEMIKETPKYVVIGTVAGLSEGVTGGGATPFVATLCASTIWNAAEELLNEDKEFDVQELVSKIVMDTALTYGPIKGYQAIEKALGETLVKKAIQRGVSHEVAAALKASNRPLELLESMVDSGKIADKTIVKLVNLSPEILAAETVAFDTTVGAGTEFAMTGDITAEGVVKYASISAVAQGMFLGFRRVKGKTEVPDTPANTESANADAAARYMEGRKIQAENRQQGRTIQQEAASEAGFYQIGKERFPYYEGSEEVVAEINGKIAKQADKILNGRKGVLSPHDAATLEDHLVNNLKTPEEVRQFMARLKERVGVDERGRMHVYQVEGVDHAARIMKAAEKRINKLAPVKPANRSRVDVYEAEGGGTTEHTIDANGVETRIVHKNSNGRITKIEDFTYDKFGNRTATVKSFEPKLTQQNLEQFEKLNYQEVYNQLRDRGIKVKTTRPNGTREGSLVFEDGGIKYTYDFDAKGNFTGRGSVEVIPPEAVTVSAPEQPVKRPATSPNEPTTKTEESVMPAEEPIQVKPVEEQPINQNTANQNGRVVEDAAGNKIEILSEDTGVNRPVSNESAVKNPAVEEHTAPVEERVAADEPVSRVEEESVPRLEEPVKLEQPVEQPQTPKEVAEIHEQSLIGALRNGTDIPPKYKAAWKEAMSDIYSVIDAAKGNINIDGIIAKTGNILTRLNNIYKNANGAFKKQVGEVIGKIKQFSRDLKASKLKAQRAREQARAQREAATRAQSEVAAQSEAATQKVEPVVEEPINNELRALIPDDNKFKYYTRSELKAAVDREMKIRYYGNVTEWPELEQLVLLLDAEGMKKDIVRLYRYRFLDFKNSNNRRIRELAETAANDPIVKQRMKDEIIESLEKSDPRKQNRPAELDQPLPAKPKPEVAPSETPVNRALTAEEQALSKKIQTDINDEVKIASLRRDDGIDINEYVRDPGNSNNALSAAYFENLKDVSRHFDEAIRSGRYAHSFEEYVQTLNEGHKLAYAGHNGDNLHYMHDGELVQPNEMRPGEPMYTYVGDETYATVSNRTEISHQIQTIAEYYGDSYRANANSTRVRLKNLENRECPRNEGTKHYYPEYDYTEKYIKEMYRTSQNVLDLISKSAGEEAILKALAEHYQYAANARLYRHINNSLFMNEVNTLLKKAGMRTMSHGILDHAAQRLQPEAFEKLFIGYYRNPNIVKEILNNPRVERVTSIPKESTPKVENSAPVGAARPAAATTARPAATNSQIVYTTRINKDQINFSSTYEGWRSFNGNTKELAFSIHDVRSVLRSQEYGKYKDLVVYYDKNLKSSVIVLNLQRAKKLGIDITGLRGVRPEDNVTIFIDGLISNEKASAFINGLKGKISLDYRGNLVLNKDEIVNIFNSLRQ